MFLAIDPVPWQDTVQGVGTLLAVVVAVVAFIWEAHRARVMERERDTALADQAKREHRAAAGSVFAWVEDQYTSAPERASYERRAFVHVGNEGNQPVYNVNVSIGVGFHTRTIGPLSVPKPIPVLPVRRTLTWDITIPLAAHDDTQSPVAEIGFTDPNGNRWLRRFDGTLEETTGKVAQAFETDDPEAAIRQLGRPNDSNNPMAVTISFLTHLQAEPEEFDAEGFRSFLAPEATGWDNVSQSDVAILRAQLGDYGLGAMTAYPAPYVAQVKIVKSSDAIGTMIAGEGFEVDALTVTLTFAPDRGWRVYGFGPPINPDELKFPPKTFAGL